MKSNKNKKKLQSTYKKTFPFILLLATILMGIGYAKVGNINLKVLGNLIAHEANGIIIEKITLSNGSSATNGNVISTYGTLLGTEITLDKNETSSVSFDITIYNNKNDNLYYFYEGVTPNGYDEDFYPNKDIIYEIDGLEIGHVLRYKDSVNFTITFKYADGVNIDEVVNTLTAYLTFKFTPYEFIADKSGGYEFVAEKDGYYNLEVWGASGYSYSEEYHGGYGSYSVGKVYLDAGTKIFIHTGGEGIGGNNPGTYEGGYNGGGKGVIDTDTKYTGSGGGATHIALVNGELSTLENNINDILLVAGGGGSVYYENNYLFLGGNGGGIEGTSGIQIKNTGVFNGPVRLLAGGGTQTSGGTAGETGAAGTFGQGGEKDALSNGGGGGFYGGGTGWASSSGGGSGYIANSRLIDKHMIVYSENPTTTAEYKSAVASTAYKTKTNLVTTHNSSPIPDVAKSGSGYARIAYLGDTTEYISIFDLEYPIVKSTATMPNLSVSTSVSGEQGGLYKSTATDSGNPTYYFRGEVNNNYVDFAGQVWRIVRINEDGTIRLVLQNSYYDPSANNSPFNEVTTDYTYMYYSNSNNENGAKTKLEAWYTTNIAPYEEGVVLQGKYYCEAAKVIGGGTAGNANPDLVGDYTPTFKCDEDGNGYGLVDAKIGLLTFDEVSFAGSANASDNINTTYYLYNNAYSWTMSPSGYVDDINKPQVWRIDQNGNINSGDVNYNRSYRPVININWNVITSGDGTENNHFVIN